MALSGLVAGLISYQHTQRNSRVVTPYRLMQIWGINLANGNVEALAPEHQRIKLDFQLDRQNGDDLIELLFSKQPIDDSPFITVSRPAVNYEIKQHLPSVQIPPLSLESSQRARISWFHFQECRRCIMHLQC